MPTTKTTNESPLDYLRRRLPIGPGAQFCEVPHGTKSQSYARLGSAWPAIEEGHEPFEPINTPFGWFRIAIIHRSIGVAMMEQPETVFYWQETETPLMHKRPHWRACTAVGNWCEEEPPGRRWGDTVEIMVVPETVPMTMIIDLTALPEIPRIKRELWKFQPLSSGQGWRRVA